MILVDTSIWIDHLRSRDDALADLLVDGEVVGHPAVTGELSLDHLARRDEVLGLLGNLPQAVLATDREVVALIEDRRLFGRGIGYVDAHLLAATMLTSGSQIWTRDQRLRAVAHDLGLDAGRD